MAFFNFKKSKTEQTGNTQTSPNQTSWDSLRDTAFAERTSSPESPIEQHKTKIFNYILTGQRQPTPLNEYTKNQAYDKFGNLLSQDASYAYEEQFLSKIAGNREDPNRGPNWVAANIAADPWQEQIYKHACAQVNIPVPQNGNALANTKSTINQFFAARDHADFSLTTPVGFEELRRNFLNQVKQQFDDQTYEGYAAAMDRLEDNLYGKRFEYHQAIDAIRTETPDALGWAHDLNDVFSGRDAYVKEVETRIERKARNTRENSPEYLSAKQTGEQLAQNYLSAMEQNPAYADAIKAAFDNYLRTHKKS